MNVKKTEGQMDKIVGENGGGLFGGPGGESNTRKMGHERGR